MLSEVDILKRLGSGDLKIVPYEGGCLTGVGYDLRLGDYGYSLKTNKKFEINKDKGISIGPQETIVVTTMEKISIPKDLSGTIHSQVKRMQLGLQAISTTADPNWIGIPLIHVTNNLKKEVWLTHGDTICTICFHELKSPSIMICVEPHRKQVDRNTLEHIALQYSEKQKYSWKNRLTSKRFLLICAILINILIFLFIRNVFDPTNELIAIIVSIMTLVSLFVIELIKSD
jgi:deoxycytidine triphosphate deaminase